MRPRRLRKRTISAIIASIAVTVVIVASFWYEAAVVVGDALLIVNAGSIGYWRGVELVPAPRPATFDGWVGRTIPIEDQRHPDALIPCWWLDAPPHEVSFPLWPIATVFALLAVRWYRQDRRVPAWHSRGCGYNLAANASGGALSWGWPLSNAED